MAGILIIETVRRSINFPPDRAGEETIKEEEVEYVDISSDRLNYLR